VDFIKFFMSYSHAGIKLNGDYVSKQFKKAVRRAGQQFSKYDLLAYTESHPNHLQNNNLHSTDSYSDYDPLQAIDGINRMYNL
jgi:hypothetical protein